MRESAAIGVVVAATVAALAWGDGKEPPSTALVDVILKNTAAVERPGVTVGDVAALIGDRLLAKRISALDLDSFTEAGKRKIEISAKRVYYRLRLAGIPPGQFRISGAEQVTVELTGHLDLAEQIVAEAKEALLRELPWPRQDVSLEAVSAVRIPKRLASMPFQFRLRTSVAPSNNIVGRRRVHVSVLADGQTKLAVAVDFDVRVYREVPIATRTINRGERLTESNVLWSRRSVDGRTAYVHRSSDWKGKAVRVNLRTGDPILQHHLRGADDEYVIQPRDKIRMIVRIGAAQVMAYGLSQERGKMNQQIRARNLASRKEVIGRVVAPGVIEVSH